MLLQKISEHFIIRLEKCCWFLSIAAGFSFNFDFSSQKKNSNNGEISDKVKVIWNFRSHNFLKNTP